MGIPWNKGLTGYHIHKKSRKGIQFNSGKTHFKIGHTTWNKGLKGYRAGIRRTPIDFKQSPETIAKRVEKTSGENHWNWKGGRGTERHRLMSQIEYKLWRTAIFVRDNYTCQECKKHGGYLEADHIKPWSLFPQLRFAIDNGRTLCRPCHKLKTKNDWDILKKGGDLYGFFIK